MNEYIPHIPAKFIVSLNVNGMSGRMLHMPSKKDKQRDILVVYGHHSSLERMYGIASLLNRYGPVTMSDLPGFGGMDSFYKIGQKPTLDNLADYLASIIKLRYKNRRFTVIGCAFGFLVVTRMLQKYPEITEKVDLVISAEGFAHKDDLTFSKLRQLFYKYAARIFSRRLPAVFFRNLILHPFMLRKYYLHSLDGKEKTAIAELQVELWRINDVRTYMYSVVEQLKLNNCESQVNLPVWHISLRNNKYFDSHILEQHMRVIYTDFYNFPIKLKKRTSRVMASQKELSKLLPPKLRNQLNKKLRV